MAPFFNRHFLFPPVPCVLARSAYLGRSICASTSYRERAVCRPQLLLVAVAGEGATAEEHCPQPRQLREGVAHVCGVVDARQGPDAGRGARARGRPLVVRLPSMEDAPAEAVQRWEVGVVAGREPRLHPRRVVPRAVRAAAAGQHLEQDGLVVEGGAPRVAVHSVLVPRAEEASRPLVDPRQVEACATHGARTRQCTEGKVHGVAVHRVRPW